MVEYIRQSGRLSLPIVAWMIYAIALPFQALIFLDSSDTYPLKYFLLLCATTLTIISRMDFLRRQARASTVIFSLGVIYGIWGSLMNAEVWVKGSGVAIGAVSILIISASILTSYAQRATGAFPVMKAFVVSVLAAIFLSMLFVFGGIKFLVPADYVGLSFRRLYGIVKSPNAFSFVIFSAIIAVTILRMERKIGVASGKIITVTLFAAFLITFSKSSIIALVVAFVFYLRKISTVRNVVGIRTLVLATLFASASIYFSGWLASAGNFNDSPILDLLRIKSNVSETGNRALILPFAINIVKDNWVFGIGPSNWKDYFYDAGVESEWDSPHVGVLEILGGSGVVGLLAYIVLMISFWRIARRFPSDYNYLLRAFLLFTILREVVEVSTVFSYAITGITFWFMLALILGSGYRAASFEAARSCGTSA